MAQFTVHSTRKEEKEKEEEEMEILGIWHCSVTLIVLLYL